MIEARGVPVNAELFHRMANGRTAVEDGLIRHLDLVGAYQNGRFNVEAFERYVVARFPDWPRTKRGQVRVDDDTLEFFSESSTEIAAFRELRSTLQLVRTPRLQVGADGRARSMLSPFGARTGRNAPRKSIFGAAKPMWGLIQPEPGRAIASLDWVAQEQGIAAILSGDVNMREAYESDDFYLTFAKQAGAIPPNASRDEYETVRSLYKVVAIGVLYGMRATTMAARAGIPLAEAERALNRHRAVFERFWAWQEHRVNHALRHGVMYSSLGWPLRVPPGCESAVRESGGPRGTTLLTLQNFPMQGCGADMMRLACSFMHDVGVELCSPVHDGFLVEADASDLDRTLELAHNAMDRASAVVLDGYRLRVKLETTAVHPQRYGPLPGTAEATWRNIQEHLQ